MSLWRRGIVLSCHPAGPGSIPGIGAWHIWVPLNLHFVECSALVSFVELLLPDGVTEMPFGIFALLLLVFVTAPVTWTSRLFRNCAWFLFLLLRNRCSLLNNFNSGHFKYMSLWRCGIVSSCHPVGPGSIPGVGAISLWKNLLQRRTWLSRLWFHQCFVRWGWIYPFTSRKFVVTEATTFSSFTGWSKFVVL